MATHGCAHAEIISASDRSVRSVTLPLARMSVGFDQSAQGQDGTCRSRFPGRIAGGDPWESRSNCRSIFNWRTERECFHRGEGSVKGEHSLRPFERRLRVRPSLMLKHRRGPLSYCRYSVSADHPEIARSFMSGKQEEHIRNKELRHG